MGRREGSQDGAPEGGRSQAARQPPAEGEHGSQGRGGSREKDGAAAELPCLQRREACLLGSGTALRPHRHTHHSVPEAIFCSRLVYQAQSLSRGAEMAEYRRPGLQGAPELQDEPQGDGKMQAPESKQGNRVTRGRPQTHTHICAGTRGPAAGADPTCEPEMLNVQRRGQTAEAARRARPAWRGQGRLSWLWGPGERLGSPRAVTTGKGPSSWPGSNTRSQGGVWAQPPSLRHPVLPHPPLEREGRAARASLLAETFTQAGCWSTSVPEASSPAPCPAQGPPA